MNRACMRPITPFQITVFSVLFAIILAVGIVSGWLLVGSLALGDFRGIAVIAAIVVCTYLRPFAVYRIFLRFFPLREGQIVAGSREEFDAQVNILFYLLLFNSLIRTHFCRCRCCAWSTWPSERGWAATPTAAGCYSTRR